MRFNDYNEELPERKDRRKMAGNGRLVCDEAFVNGKSSEGLPE